MYNDQRLRPSERLRHAHEYHRVFQHGKKLVCPLFIMYIRFGSQSCPRLGMAVSKRMGKAVARNRIKRLIRELFRRHKDLLLPSCDVVFVARRQAAGASLDDYTEQFLTLLRYSQQSGRKT